MGGCRSFLSFFPFAQRRPGLGHPQVLFGLDLTPFPEPTMSADLSQVVGYKVPDRPVCNKIQYPYVNSQLRLYIGSMEQEGPSDLRYRRRRKERRFFIRVW